MDFRRFVGGVIFESPPVFELGVEGPGRLFFVTVIRLREDIFFFPVFDLEGPARFFLLAVVRLREVCLGVLVDRRSNLCFVLLRGCG